MHAVKKDNGVVQCFPKWVLQNSVRDSLKRLKILKILDYHRLNNAGSFESSLETQNQTLKNHVLPNAKSNVHIKMLHKYR